MYSAINYILVNIIYRMHAAAAARQRGSEAAR